MADGTFTDLTKQAHENVKNKGGRPKGSSGPSRITKKQVLAARREFERLVPKAMAAVEAVLDDPDADHAVKLKAAAEVANRTWGTSVNMSVQEKIISDERGSSVDVSAISKQDTETLLKLSKMLSDFVERESNMIDVTPEQNHED